MGSGVLQSVEPIPVAPLRAKPTDQCTKGKREGKTHSATLLSGCEERPRDIGLLPLRCAILVAEVRSPAASRANVHEPHRRFSVGIS